MADTVVLVSGGAAVTPYTDVDHHAAEGLPAGNTLTALRRHLLDAGARVFTAPARIGVGEAREDSGWQGFSDVPIVLPAQLTINAVGTIDAAGVALAAFVRWLAEAHGVTSLDLVAHSMGGLFSRAALRELQGNGPIVSRLVTLGTPWDGSLLGDVIDGEITLGDAHGDEPTTQILQRSHAYAAANSQGAAEQVSRRFLRNWNQAQPGVLDQVRVTAIGGAHFHDAADPRQLWPHDGLVSLESARAEHVPHEVAPTIARQSFDDDVHSIFFADAFELPWERALTWNPDVHAYVSEALDGR
ncbi:alpha/beta fold hydrolase [Microbacterium sp. BG28]|uniref:esterase/lipase family protein n=1 Tax=Microbacterium sp. BG28 TaxID=3097356 RepID=UPI002A5AE848|nr:alpha/beta fold hydrolase [Microbacterium sp. BG28]MDY0830012.1 alpha/beta fold hydrolase [Microbacterium sp. BG28]